MYALDYEHRIYDGDDILIPPLCHSGTRLRVNLDRSQAILEHEYCDEYVHNGEELEEWTWHPALVQPDENEIKIIIKELQRYVEDEGDLPRKVL